MGFDDLQRILPEQIKVTDRFLQFCLVGTVGVLAFICIALVTVLGLHHGGVIPVAGVGRMTAQSDTCMTSQCLATAASFREKMNSTVSPCDNFYQYACGGFHTRHTLPPDHSEVSVLSDMFDRQEERLRELIEAPIIRKGASSTERKLKNFFKSCTHDYGRMKHAGKPLLELVKRHLKGWYVLDPAGWKSNGWTLQNAMQKVHSELDVSALFRLRVGRYWRTGVASITISYSRFGMPSGWYEDREEVADSYQDFMRGMASLLVRDANTSITPSEMDTRVEQFVSDAFSQERNMSQLLRAARTSRDFYRSGLVPLTELEQNFTQIPWRAVIQSSFEGFEVSDSTQIRIASVTYLTLLDQMIRNETANKDRILNNYFVWQMLLQYAPYLSAEYQHAKYRYYNEAYGSRTFPSTWESCLRQVKWRLSAAMGAVYVQTHVGDDAKKEVGALFDTLQDSTADHLPQLHWMDNRTTSQAVKKVRGITRTIGLPDQYYDSNYMDNLHSRLVINTTSSYLENLLNVNKFRKFLLVAEVQSGATDKMWQFSHQAWGFGVKPYFSWRGNHLVLPAGAMQAPLYRKGAPAFYNYGTLGTAMAEDMATAYNEHGRFVMTNGTFSDWWSMVTYGDYLKAKSCFHDYYTNYTVGPFMVDGEQKTIKLNPRFRVWRAMNRVAGLKIGLAAYRSSNTEPEPIPIGINLTPDQAFFLSYAQTQCTIRRDAYAYRMARYGYIPPENMLNGEMSHVTEFADAFQCKKESNMVARDKCNVY